MSTYIVSADQARAQLRQILFFAVGGVFVSACQTGVELESDQSALRSPSRTLVSPIVDDRILPIYDDGDDPENCIDWGRVTYENTIADVIDRNCVKCHSPAKGTEGSGEKWAVAPQSPSLHTWDDMKYWISTICYRVVDQADTDNRMPPVGSEAALETEDLELLEAWCDDYDDASGTSSEKQDYAMGGEVPTIEVTGVERTYRRGSRYTVSYEAFDSDSSDATVAIFYDDDKEGFDGETIYGCLDMSHQQSNRFTRELSLTEESYVWNTRSLTPGVYYVYACIFDGDTVACDYADEGVKLNL